MNARMSTVVAATLLVAAVSTSASARAADVDLVRDVRPRQLGLQLAVDIDTVWRLDRGYAAFTRDRSATGGGLSVSYDVIRSERVALALGLGWQNESARQGGERQVSGASDVGVVVGSHRSDLDVNTYALSAVLRWSALTWLEPQLRMALGAAAADLSITVDDGSRFQGDAWSPQASAGAGLRVRSRATRVPRLPGSPALAVAAVAEGGFVLGAPLKFDVAPVPPDDATLARDRLSSPSVPAGDLRRAHPYMRISLAVLF